MSFFETITPWDASVLQAIQGIKCDFLDTFMAVMSFLGEKRSYLDYTRTYALPFQKDKGNGSYNALRNDFGIAAR